jgi:amino acid transporter
MEALLKEAWAIYLVLLKAMVQAFAVLGALALFGLSVFGVIWLVGHQYYAYGAFALLALLFAGCCGIALAERSRTDKRGSLSRGHTGAK